MSMPQSGPPDPNATGPVSGGPQQPYDQQPPPPHQPPPPGPAGPPGAPPRSFTAPGAAAAKPPVLMIGAIACGVLTLVWLLRVVATLMGVDSQFGIPAMGASIVYAVYFLAMAAASGAAAGLAMAGNDFGRIFAAAVGGAATWEAAAWWQGIIGALVTGHGVDAHYPWFPAVVAALGGFVGIAVIVTMAMPAIGNYVAEKRRKPAGAPPAGPGMPPPPGGPGMPPAGGQVYGGPPPAGPGAPPPGAQPPAGPPPAGPQPGGYGAPPPAGPQPGDYGAPPPAGPQY